MTKQELTESLDLMADYAQKAAEIAGKIRILESVGDATHDILDKIQSAEYTNVDEAVKIIEAEREDWLMQNKLPEFRGQVVDVFENYCDNNGITITNQEKIEYDQEAGYAQDENAAILFGSDYDAVADSLGNLILEEGSPYSITSVTKAAMNAINIFQDILKERGNKTLDSQGAAEILTGLLDTFKAWDMVNAA